MQNLVLLTKGHIGFKELAAKLAHRHGVHNANALAAWIGRRKYGASRMASAAANGKPITKSLCRFSWPDEPVDGAGVTKSILPYSRDAGYSTIKNHGMSVSGTPITAVLHNSKHVGQVHKHPTEGWVGTHHLGGGSIEGLRSKEHAIKAVVRMHDAYRIAQSPDSLKVE